MLFPIWYQISMLLNKLILLPKMAYDSSTYDASPSPSFDPVEFNTTTQLPIKLNSSNYPTWYRQIHSLLVARDLKGYVIGTMPCPAATITTSSGSSSNPAYCFWVRQDKYLYIALLGSCDAKPRAIMSTTATSRATWLALERAFAPIVTSCKCTSPSLG